MANTSVAKRWAGAIQEISEWPIEAKDEDTQNYFYHFREVERIEDGRVNYVIGRKGSGKTAIAEYLSALPTQRHDVFSKKLTFKNFPFNILYKFSDQEYTRPNQYITLWQYVIYSAICSMMAQNEGVASTESVELKKLFKIDLENALAASVKRITGREFGASILGVGGSIKSDSALETADLSQCNSVLDSYIKRNIDGSTYFIVFDELDEDYRNILQPDRREEYFELLIGLFKAVQNIRQSFRAARYRVSPVIFLRSDIFDLCRDPDKNKWLDRAAMLNWDASQLQKMINFRLARALELNGIEATPSEAWRRLIKSREVRQGRRKLAAFKFLMRPTFNRPRDIISYLRECAKVADNLGETYINSSTIKEADGAHSAYMRREIIDEAHPVLEDISELLGVLAEIRKPILSIDEFRSGYERYMGARGERVDKLSFEDIVRILYHFNVIGNITTGNHQVYAYNSDAKVLNFEQNICIHRGLLKSLDMV